MIAALLQVAVPTQADEVTVIGQRLRGWQGALTECAAPAGPQMIALAQDKALAPAERKARQAAMNDTIGRCMIARRDRLIAELADRRNVARTGR